MDFREARSMRAFLWAEEIWLGAHRAKTQSNKKYIGYNLHIWRLRHTFNRKASEEK